ncbi:MAG: hypothetical protein RIQ54_402 [Candidatus Parcubacteria bacterium]|jgi:hypothetical protein
MEKIRLSNETAEDQAVLEQAKENQESWERVSQLQKESLFIRSNADHWNTTIEREGQKFSIELITDPKSPDISQVQELFESVFGSEEVDPEEILRQGIEGITSSGEPDEVLYKIFTVKNSTGKVVSVVSGGVLNLRDKKDTISDRNVLMIAYAVTDPSTRMSGLAREAYISSLMEASVQSEMGGQKLDKAAGECTYTSEKFWNRVGWKRTYQEETDGTFREMAYIQPALDFNEDTGLPVEENSEAPEHLMIDGFKSEVTSKDAVAIVQAFYRWCNRWPKDAFKSDEAYRAHIEYIDAFFEEFRSQIDQEKPLISLTKEERDRKIASGVKFLEYSEADNKE